jgi:hypothetical protein
MTPLCFHFAFRVSRFAFRDLASRVGFEPTRVQDALILQTSPATRIRLRPRSSECKVKNAKLLWGRILHFAFYVLQLVGPTVRLELTTSFVPGTRSDRWSYAGLRVDSQGLEPRASSL